MGVTQTLVIIRREYLQGVRSRAFVLSTLLGPLLLTGTAALPLLLAGVMMGRPLRLAVVDYPGGIYEPLRRAIHLDATTATGDLTKEVGRPDGAHLQEGWWSGAAPMRFSLEQIPAGSSEEVAHQLSARVRRDELDAYLIIPAEALSAGEASYYGRTLSDPFVIERLREELNRVIVARRLGAAQVNEERWREISRPLGLRTFQVLARGAEERAPGRAFFLALGFGVVIVLAVLFYGQVVLSSVVEEKGSRLFEVLASSAGPLPLMTGKLLGTSLVALTQFGVWLLLFSALRFGGSPDGWAPASPRLALFALLCFILGFLLYATLMVVVGAVVTSEKEASHLAVYLSLLPLPAVFLSIPVLQNPDSRFAFWVSLIPCFSPVTMFARIVAAPPPWWEIALSGLLALVAAAGLLHLAGRIYRVGMLMYGKPARLAEVLRWMTHP